MRDGFFTHENPLYDQDLDLSFDLPPEGTAADALNIETWSEEWTEELLTAYHSLLDQCEANGYGFLQRCTYPDFVEFAYKFSTKSPHPCP